MSTSLNCIALLRRLRGVASAGVVGVTTAVTLLVTPSPASARSADCQSLYQSGGAGTSPLHRLYNPGTADHLYTISDYESQGAQAHGYRFEHDEGYVSQYPGHYADGTPLSPMYRLSKPQTHDHLYTASLQERDRVIAQSGYRYEGLMGYMGSHSRGTSCFAGPMYRMYNAGTQHHFYTLNSGERDTASAHGWHYEWIIGYSL
jgi:hypothetical protein